MAYSKMGEHEKAITDYEAALEMNPYYPDIYVSMGIDYFNMDDFDSAIEAYETAISLKPDYGRAYYLLSFAYSSKGEPPIADDMLTKSAELGYQP